MERFIKYIPSEKSSWLRENYPFAFLLLSLIAERARRESGHFDGLEIGDAMLGDHKKSGLTRQQYRTALDKLVEFNIIEIKVKARNCDLNKILTKPQNSEKVKKSTIKPTIKGTLVNLKDSSIWNINIENSNHRSNHQATIKQPSSNHEQEGIRMNKKEEDIKQQQHLVSQSPESDKTFVAAAEKKFIFETIEYYSPGGLRKSITRSEIFKHFLKSSFSHEIVNQGIMKVLEKIKMDEPIGNFLKLLEIICKGIEQKPKEVVKSNTNQIRGNYYESSDCPVPKSYAPSCEPGFWDKLQNKQ